MGEKAGIDMEYMSKLAGKNEETLYQDLKGVIFLNPLHGYGNVTEAKYLMADEYLSGNVREKLITAKKSAEVYPEDYKINVEALEKVQPIDLTASEISVRLGATWLPQEVIQQFMFEFLDTPRYAQWNIKVHFSPYTGEWNIEGNDTFVCRKFAKDFNEFNSYLEAAKIQGFKWEVPAYVDEETGEVVDVAIDENTYLILVLRYKELTGGSGGTGNDDVPYDLAGYITEIDTGLIDSDYMNSRFDKYIKLLSVEGTTQEAIEQAETELHKTFATLSQEEQKYANIFLHDIQRGDVKVSEGKSLRDYINEYLSKARNDQIHRVSSALGLDENLLRNIMSLKLNENNLNEFGRYDELKKTVDKAKAKEYFEKVEGTKIIPPKVNVKVDKLLRDFIISGGYEIQMPTEDE